MNLFYTPPEQVQENRLTITGDEARHAVKVLRFKVGDLIHVTDGAGNRYEGRIEFPGQKNLRIAIEKTSSEPKACDLLLALGLIKNRQRLEFAIEKATELGCTGIILFKSDHSERGKVNLERLQSIVLSAMKQSLRTYLPEIRFEGSLEEVIEQHSTHRLIVAHEKQKHNTPGLFNLNKNYLVLIGPEGGFSDEEINLLRDKQAQIISLGDHRLRSETAVVALLSRFVKP